MSKVACQYAIIRFAPYVETGEFANVGILLMASKVRFFGFRLQARRYKRIAGFFEELDSKLYREAIHALKDELERIHWVLKANGFDRRRSANDIEFAKQLFSEIVRPRESILRFSDPGVVLTDDPEEKLQELFSFYVERSFVTKQYQETILEDGVRKWLNNARIGDRFQRLTIGDEDYQATFPFVEQIDQKPVKAIKPLHLAQGQPSKIMEHGAAWLFRVNELKHRARLPENVLFTVSGPEDKDERRQRAFTDIVGRLEDTGVEVTEYVNRQRILEFAAT
ncbi:DUF3037 domain-containing protein [Thiorhodococcus fuscus]|uniref:DUF3037 domain-containing protein n=1 Tax=Thiorhodococcus fuscus TaxID=527200 RepID=A0ABW4Y5Y3_9GAMM